MRSQHPDLEAVLPTIEALSHPVSVFLYGSRARQDVVKGSDYEVGVLIPEHRYVGRSEFAPLVSDSSTRVYPYRYERFLAGDPETPFQKAIFLRDIALTATTLTGDRVVENLTPPAITVLDAMQDLRFNIGRALCSLLTARAGAQITASEFFYKSCLFGARVLAMTEGKFPTSYHDMAHTGRALASDKYAQLIDGALRCREREDPPPMSLLYRNLAFLTEFVEPRLLPFSDKPSMTVLLK